MSKFGVAKAGWGKATELYKAWKRNKSSKKLFKEASGGMQHPVIKSFKTKKNLTKRRKDFEDIIHHVNKHGKSPGSSKIKRDAAIKVSKIHDKYDNLSKKK